jgi:hypothetical protein
MPKSIIVEFLDAPNIINDGVSENTLRIGVFNTALPDAGGANAGNIVLKAGTPMYFWFITDDLEAKMSPERPWGLTSKDLLYGPTVRVSAQPGEWTAAQHADVAQRPDLKGYALTPAKDVVLKPGQHVSVTISGLKSGLPSGPTTAYFSYSGSEVEHKATYGPVQKSPLIAREQNVYMSLGNARNNFHGFACNTGHLNFHVPPDKSHVFSEGGDDNNPWGTRYLKIDKGGMRVAPDAKLAENKLSHGELLHFGADGQYQVMHKGSGYHKRPTLALHAQDTHALGFYSSNWTPLLEVEGGTGNAYVKGNVNIAGGTESAGKLTVKDRVIEIGGGYNDWTAIYMNGIQMWEIGANQDQFVVKRWGKKGDLNTLKTLFTIDKDGNVLFPAGKLDVNGALTIGGNTNLNGSLNVNRITGFGFHFITPQTLYSSSGLDTGVKEAGLGAYIPDGATAVILEASGGTQSGDVTEYVSPDAGRNPAYKLLRANQNDRKGDMGAITNQGIFPVSADRKIWYWMEGSNGGFTYGIEIRLVGYFGPAKQQ